VGVFVDAPPRLVSQTARRLGLNLVQLHGRETLREVAELAPIRAIKAVGIRDRASVDQAQAFLQQGQPGNLAAVLLDAITDRSFGGTGVSFDWNLVAGLPETIRASHRLPSILAGGLTAENVAEAIRTVRPYAVDVSSGVEASPGKKDRQKMVQFVRAARDAFAGLDAAADASA
jgi:phosphoribosylanthranilate isomerase